jgi:hypothetical protein
MFSDEALGCADILMVLQFKNGQILIEDEQAGCQYPETMLYTLM